MKRGKKRLSGITRNGCPKCPEFSSIREGNYLETLEPFLEEVKYKRMFVELKESGGSIWDETDGIDNERISSLEDHEISELIHILLAGMLYLMTTKGDLIDFINIWKEDLRKHFSIPIQLENFFENITKIIGYNPLDILYDINESFGNRMTAAILISTSKKYVPKQILYANIILIDGFISNGYIDTVQFYLDATISEGWRFICQNQKFHLNSPAIDVPQIETAYNNSISGYNKVAGVILAAKEAVKLEIPIEFLERIKNNMI